ncbi:MAG TPA: TIGR03089 family protein [Nocardioidaceae bacterium]|nr:TIGR03089 family protein [Nocardioidaceae bacterium]
MPPPPTLPALLDRLVADDATRPLVTYYDDATGERIELSVKSFDNAVAKTANLLQDELGTDPGETCCLLLPTHWQAAVWVFAVAACSLRLVDDPAGADVVVCHPGTLDTATTAGARDVVAMALQPLGGPSPDPLPSGVLDHGLEAPGQPDVFIASTPVEPSTELSTGQTQQSVLRRAAAAADATGLGAGGRLLTDRSPADPDGLVTGMLAAAVAGGSVVLVRNGDPAGVDRRVQQEQVTVTAWE